MKIRSLGPGVALVADEVEVRRARAPRLHRRGQGAQRAHVVEVAMGDDQIIALLLQIHDHLGRMLHCRLLLFHIFPKGISSESDNNFSFFQDYLPPAFRLCYNLIIFGKILLFNGISTQTIRYFLSMEDKTYDS